MFEVTKSLVSGTTQWNQNFVLPAMQCCLATGATAMGQTLQSLFDQNCHIPDLRARVGIAVVVVAQNAAASGGAAGSAAAATSASVNEALKSAADKIGNDGAGRAEVAQLGALSTAAARDESESQALCSAARDALQGSFGAAVTLLISQDGRSSTPRKVRVG